MGSFLDKGKNNLFRFVIDRLSRLKIEYFPEFREMIVFQKEEVEQENLEFYQACK